MKTFKRLLFFIAGICLLIACSKDEPAVMPVYKLQNDALACGKVFKVEPTKGTDITENLKQAFADAKAAGPGSVVQLPKGNFELGFIEIHEFFGSFVGAGKGKTIITAKTGLDCEAIWGIGQFPFLIKFVGGDIKMNNMTLQTPPGEITSTGGDFWGLLLFADYSFNFEPKKCYIKALVDNVEFIGHPGGWYNCWYALQAAQDDNLSSPFKRSHIDMTVTNCTFDTFAWGTNMSYIKEGKLVVGTTNNGDDRTNSNKEGEHGDRTPNNGNVYTNCYEDVSFFDDINVDISVAGNIFNIPAGWTDGLDVDNYPYGQELQTKSPQVNVEGNIFNNAGENLGIWIHDHQHALYPEDNLPMLILIRKNQFNMNNVNGAGGCMYIRETKNTLVCNNKFSGTGMFAIYVDAFWPGTYNENGLIRGNNFSHATYTWTPIYLDTFTKNWTVECGELIKEAIIDLGVNNRIIGTNVKNFDDHHEHNIIGNHHSDKERDRNNDRGHKFFK
jgi:hypothetical protein